MATIFKLAKAVADNKEEVSAEKKSTKNKQRVLALSSRGINYRQRHLLNDLEALLPHFKKDSKLDTKFKLGVLNELAELNNCNNCVFFEVRKRQDLYMWTSKTPNGPSIKFHVQNIHTMDELKMTGNCLKGSRHILSFDKNFESEPHLILIKEVFTHIFGVPKGARRSKPFIDHVISFTIADNRIWFRNFQIVEKDPTDPNKKFNDKDVSLVEIGPRFVLNVIRIFEGSFCGATVYANPEFITPNQIRHSINIQKAARYNKRKMAQSKRQLKIANIDMSEDSANESNKED
ncbi:Brix-domain-containing protein [Rhizophagus irregularis]|uniref:Brix-domain-containing protein n=3 Tax=Rhizophagus irregularis TaxID=588596 RepID=A0A2I1G572_9GLOM|nr:ribosome biogenesis protein BRX1 [Rhizophagus irregularis DAOM 181602=DAOM 197198]EXX57559.1 Brx1p [Rhizophagus irregularis DAOM 197198w]PKC07648.1 Brix-domain-containing protein [Rhizophagus irregularis]PKC63207.1 Brix-domain-containing protein [Rhizophagus irregularis]PKK77407.1 Brix-domain-containing protein [Rhizophagus irregularis]PKY23877.1 Brix-domain-containing protein [Rhizophagus irregularis]|eukprot:XP_025169464.1 ribosome biogenesis protein BRX1 [Rhizophagus irregularis DAOM 181602=DAOM 197198]